MEADTLVQIPLSSLTGSEDSDELLNLTGSPFSRLYRGITVGLFLSKVTLGNSLGLSETLDFVTSGRAAIPI